MPPAAEPGQGSSCWTSGAGLIPLQPGRSLRPSSARTGATQTRLEFFRGKVDCRGKTKALSKSSRRTTGLDQSVSAPRLHPGEATGAHWWGGSPFWSLCSSNTLTSQLTLWSLKACGSSHGGYGDLSSWQTFSQN